MPDKEVRKKTKLPSLSAIITAAIVIFLLYALFTGMTYRFYASFLFFFYSYIQRMWLAVVCLGVFQTALVMPLRIVNLSLAKNIEEFEEKVEEVGTKTDQQLVFKEKIRGGNPIILWYTINFFVQTISYLSIGRLFLTDFYRHKLNPQLLYSFVKYPQYPIKDIFFKIPYPVVTKTVDLGIWLVLVSWAAVLLLKIAKRRIDSLDSGSDASVSQLPAGAEYAAEAVKNIVKFGLNNVILFFILSWIVIRNFPTILEMRIFTGDISIPNNTLNRITAIGAGFLIIWLNFSKINKKVEMARQAKIDEKIIKQTEKEMFKNTVKNAAVIGLGAYFITRLIPSAFELSIFTFEIISFMSPFTLDRAIFSKGATPKPK